MSNDFSDSRIRHLEMIQGVITRLAGNNASHKNYCVTLVSAAIGLAAVLERPTAALIALLPIMVFAVLDAQYLRIEKRYRLLYEEVRSEPIDRPPDFRLTPSSANGVGFWSAFWTWSIQVFYVPTLVGILITIVAMEIFYGRIVL